MNLENVEYDEIEREEPDDLFIEEEGDSESTCTSSSPSQNSADVSQRAKTLLSRHFRSERSPKRLAKTLSMEVSSRARHANTLHRDKTIGATMKDILKRRQRGMYQIQGKELCQEKDSEEGMLTSVQGKKLIPSEIRTPAILRGAANLSMARWDWKSVFYNWALPLDQIILAFRGVSCHLLPDYILTWMSLNVLLPCGALVAMLSC